MPQHPTVTLARKGEARPSDADALPPVLRERARLERALGGGIDNDAARRTAFTLRLDADRHLRLRLASAISGASSQALVTQALDDLFASMPGLETLCRTADGA